MAGDSSFSEFLDNHKQQLLSHAVPIEFWETLCKKLQNHIFDAGENFTILKFEYQEKCESDPLYRVVVSNENGIKKDNRASIYLIDHAWTYSINTARSDLRSNPGLLNRMCDMMRIASNIETEEDKIETVFNEMWKYNNSYTIKSNNIDMPVWYIMDEFGSAIQHCDEPNMRLIPFIYINESITYSVLFPINNIDYEDETTIDYVEHYQDSDIRKVLLNPWFPNSYIDLDYNQIEPGVDYFASGHIPEEIAEECNMIQISIPENKILKVYSEYKYINEYLTHPRFEIVDNENDADILWFTHHFKDFKNLCDNHSYKFINQFPYEYLITIKDLLSIICRRNSRDTNPNTLQTYPEWLPTTYNLKTELLKFISYYQNREEKGLNNLWIIKPFNLARSLDSYITNNVNLVIKSATSGPKIIQKYIENPILFYRNEIDGHVKFDIRYIILLKSVKPLKVFIYKKFFLRFSNKVFELSHFDDYEKHFTVMNYDNDKSLCKILCDDFKLEFEKQNPNDNWEYIEMKIVNMFRSVFDAATMKQAPLGIGHNLQSRSLYAADLMLTKSNTGDIIPQLLEINWMPDCARACQYYKDFYNDIFSVLFLNELKSNIFYEL